MKSMGIRFDVRFAGVAFRPWRHLAPAQVSSGKVSVLTQTPLHPKHPKRQGLFLFWAVVEQGRVHLAQELLGLLGRHPLANDAL